MLSPAETDVQGRRSFQKFAVSARIAGMSLPEDPTGLRERKRVQTRARIERAAVDLVLSDGLEQVTVDAISERADISPRTFFNYFDSKEDAILGVQPSSIDEHVWAEHARRYEAADLAGSVMGLIFLVLRPSLRDPGLRANRLRILRQNPSLLGRQAMRMARMSEELTESVQRILDERAAPADGTVSPGVAETLTMAAVGAFRAATREWMCVEGDGDPSPGELESRGAALVREVLKL